MSAGSTDIALQDGAQQILRPEAFSDESEICQGYSALTGLTGLLLTEVIARETGLGGRR